MEDSPLFPINNEDEPNWAETDDLAPSFTIRDTSNAETWADFMTWDPTNSGSQVDSLDINANPDALLDDQLLSASSDAFAFGQEAQIESAFDFDFNAFTSGQDVRGLSDAHVFDSNDFAIISPSALKVNTSRLAVYPPAPPTVSSTRTSLDHSNRSPASTTESQTTPPSSTSEQGSPEPPRQTNNRKRKSTEANSTAEKPPRKNAKGLPVKKTSHNMIEKRYRNKLNDKIEELKNSVPSLKKLSTAGADDDDDGDDLDGLTPAHKTNKATILAKATEYIKHLEKKIKQQQEEMQSVKNEVNRYRKLELSEPMAFPQHTSTSQNMQFQEDEFGSSHPPSEPESQSDLSGQGLIPVPEEILSLQASSVKGPHYGNRYVSHAYQTSQRGQAGKQQQNRPIVQGRGGSGSLNKLMVGALAGLMILEGMNEHDTSDEKPGGRGLSAIPWPAMHVLRRAVMVSRYSADSHFSYFTFFRPILLLSAVLYLIYPIITSVLRPTSKSKVSSAVRSIPTITLASPVELRQKAWLTASQGVWIPHHNIIYELAAIALKASKFCLRRILGVQGYLFVTRGSTEHEESRIKTWKIALDAQLTGGDVEISATHLILTLFASGTLPSSSALLMLKALHTRILLWRFAKLGFAGWYLFDIFCAKMSRRYWNKARNQLREEMETSNTPESEKLPEHLAALLQLDCLDVLLDPVVQRAYNLAWNRPIAENSEPDVTMDAVVEDFAIASPLDALAAWYSTYILDKALTTTLGSPDLVTSKLAAEDVQEALRVAPPNSTAQTRALVSHSVLLDVGRRSIMLTAVENVNAGEPLTDGKSVVTNSIGVTPVPQDVKVALMLAKCSDLLGTTWGEQAVDAIAAERCVQMLLNFNHGIADASKWTLLSFVAGYKLLNALGEQSKVSTVLMTKARETLAGSLRLYIGKAKGRSLGLSNKARGRVIDRCLALRSIAGDEKSDRESGYASAEAHV